MNIANLTRRSSRLVLACALLAPTFGCGTEEDIDVESTSSELGLVTVPGLVMGLQHNLNQAGAGTVMFSAMATQATHQRGGDVGAPIHRGYEWWSSPDTGGDPAALRLPPGVVVALKHNANQGGVAITSFGRDATVSGDFTNFKRQVGGDRGASSGVGYFWYESTGAGFTDWASIDAILPKFTVVGLKHSANQPNKVFVWNGVTFDPVKTSPVPSGFKRVVGGDLGAPSGHGYYWYEKTTGTEIVSQPTFRLTLPRSINLQSGDAAWVDKDGDCLVDDMEDFLARFLRPFVSFDNEESGRQWFEPVTVFRLYKTSRTTIRIRWIFLFKDDTGYGPSSWCDESHAGDNDTADWDLQSDEAGVVWTMTKATVAFKGLSWPTNSRIEVVDKTFPVVYMAGSKHHEYFTKDVDGSNSLYTEGFCNDDVNGRGASFVVSAADVTGLPSNNVGEPAAHPSSRFVDALPMFDGNKTIWGGEPFYAVGSNRAKADGTGNPVLPAPVYSCMNGCPHSPCSTGAALSPSCFGAVATVCAFDPFCCNNEWDQICVAEVAPRCF